MHTALRLLTLVMLLQFAVVAQAEEGSLPEDVREIIDEFAATQTDITDNLNEAIAELQTAANEAIAEERSDAIESLERLARRYQRRDALAATHCYREILRLDLNHQEAREWFQAIGTLDAILAELAQDPAVATDMLGNPIANVATPAPASPVSADGNAVIAIASNHRMTVRLNGVEIASLAGGGHQLVPLNLPPQPVLTVHLPGNGGNSCWNIAVVFPEEGQVIAGNRQQWQEYTPAQPEAWWHPEGITELRPIAGRNRQVTQHVEAAHGQRFETVSCNTTGDAYAVLRLDPGQMEATTPEHVAHVMGQLGR